MVFAEDDLAFHPDSLNDAIEAVAIITTISKDSHSIGK